MLLRRNDRQLRTPLKLALARPLEKQASGIVQRSIAPVVVFIALFFASSASAAFPGTNGRFLFTQAPSRARRPRQDWAARRRLLGKLIRRRPLGDGGDDVVPCAGETRRHPSCPGLVPRPRGCTLNRTRARGNRRRSNRASPGNYDTRVGQRSVAPRRPSASVPAPSRLSFGRCYG
jgi:hypothetical protein